MDGTLFFKSRHGTESPSEQLFRRGINTDILFQFRFVGLVVVGFDFGRFGFHFGKNFEFFILSDFITLSSIRKVRKDELKLII